MGSPPPMRGKVKATPPHTHEPRITPAYAGKRLSLIFRIRLRWGSPPPMRGKAYLTQDGKLASRITPAYAGKSLQLASTRSACRDHPRLCGEKTLILFMMFSSMGSPPPMRGNVFISSAADAAAGITPAYAGKSPGFCLDSPPLKDHPRLCGEKFPGRALTVSTIGSPPPLRGKVENSSCC